MAFFRCGRNWIRKKEDCDCACAGGNGKSLEKEEAILREED